jgi:hypothetical protein
VWIIENSAFVLGCIFFEWKKKIVIQGLISVGVLSGFTLITWVIFYQTQKDLIISILNLCLVTKCILLTCLLSKISIQILYRWLAYIFLISAVWSVGLLLMHGIDSNHGFSGSFGDRNYFAAYVAIIFASFQMTSLVIKGMQRENSLVLHCYAVTAMALISLTASRSGFVSILWCLLLLLFTLKKHNVKLGFILLGLLGIMYSLDLLQPIIFRLQHTAIDSLAERIRFLQYEAFIKAFELNPIGIMFGFGPIASTHLDWYWSSLEREGIVQHIYVLHNTSLEVILSFGVVGLWLILRFCKVIDWKFLIFFFLISSFNNLLGFLPLYVFIGAALSINNFSSQLNAKS